MAGLAPLCDGDVILYSADPQAEALTKHQSDGGKAVLVRQDRVVLANGSSESFLPGLGRLTIWRATHAGVSLESLLAAVAAGWALGIPLNLIGAGVEAFEADLQAALASLAAVADPGFTRTSICLDEPPGFAHARASNGGS